MSGSANPTGVVPASLSYFTIYNPTLGGSDESVQDQIVYYFRASKEGSKARKGLNALDANEKQDETNRRLREVGLAQATVQFATGFSDGSFVDSVETVKSRTIVHNIEADWWLLASINLTRVTRPSETSVSSLSNQGAETEEFSSREVAIPKLLIQQLLRAHNIFLLHHGHSLSDLWSRLPRDKFCAILKRFWEPFLRNWDVLLHGNPAVDIHNGMKLSAGGELGIGVGEEEWGSGEREVLEGFIQRTDGLVDLLISRFDGRNSKVQPITSPSNPQCLIGFDVPQPSDGVIFSGVGSLTRESLRNISAWTEWLAMYGPECYGVRENPNSDSRRRRARKDKNQDGKTRDRQKHEHNLPKSSAATDQGDEPRMPPPIVRPHKGLEDPTKMPNVSIRDVDKQQNAQSEESALGAEVVKYLTFGVYGSSWGIPAGRPVAQSPRQNPTQERHGANAGPLRASAESDEISGFFLIGLLGNVEDDANDEDSAANMASQRDRQGQSRGRLLMRNLHVDRVKENTAHSRESRSPERLALDQTYHDRLRVVVYVQAPFLFTFLFENRTDSLALPFFYRSLHHQLGPLRRPLLKSTDPAKVTQRLWEAANPRSTSQARNVQLIRDLVHDPNRLTIHASIPNIPEPGSGTGEASADWSRVEALGVHSQILNTYVASRQHWSEIERTCKTSRGWWVVWMRLPQSASASSEHQQAYREAILIRRANDPNIKKAREVSSGFGFGFNRGGDNAGGWQSRIAEGIGIDAKQYIEGLLSLSR